MNNDSQLIRFDYNGLLAENIGTENGVSTNEINVLYKEIARAQKEVSTRVNSHAFNLPTEEDLERLLIKVTNVAEELYDVFDNVILIGIGGSSLGAKTIFNALCSKWHNELPKNLRRCPKFYVLENIDPETFLTLGEIIDMRRTTFIVVSKSGETLETISQFLFMRNHLKKVLNFNLGSHFTLLTDNLNSTLGKIAIAENIRVIELPKNVGGRFSVLGAVGLLPAAILNKNIEDIIRGAKDMQRYAFETNIYKNAPLMDAVLHYILMKRGKNISVLMPYSDCLGSLSEWYCQLWAESLGKEKDNLGKSVYCGQTPVKALGAVDQHSQLQLYLGGPKDKIVTFLRVETYRADENLPTELIEILGNKVSPELTFGNLINFEQEATETALSNNGCPNCTLSIPHINEYTLGQLFEFFMLETAYCGSLLNINTYDQPAVEEIKNATKKFLSGVDIEYKNEKNMI